ncbi:ribonuclease P protein component [Nevskia soli]|jgi:ribonuclease P protein component|uniref:ribonuclease P protein component n=1 Tax=Nevskia soli TaxID=418856 RepID=UPI0015D81EFE|nr:ribonuclease P protein component [Nevskia soli]
MAAPFFPAVARAAVTSSLSVPKGNTRILACNAAGFSKSVRILRSKDFRKVYDQGTRFTCGYFAAFCLLEPSNAGPRLGFTTPRALGNAVVRNRIRRRIREAVRQRLYRLDPQWSIVINPRRKALDGPFPEIEREIERLITRCNGLSQPSSAAIS